MLESSDSNQSLQIKDYAQLILKRKWYLIMPSIIVPLVAILTTFFISPIYESTTSILMKEANVLPPTVQRGLESPQRGNMQSTLEIENMMASQIKSAKYIKSLIAKLNIPVPEAIKNAVSENTVNLEDVSAAELAEDLLVTSIRSKITVHVSGSNVITISVTSSSPAMARRMTQALAEIFLEENLAQELAGIQGNLAFTEEQLAVYRDKLYDAQNKLKEFRQGVITNTVEQDTTTLAYNLNSIFSAVEALDIEISNAEQEQSRLRIELLPSQVDLGSVVLPSKVEKLKSDLMNTIPKLAELLGRYSWRDAKVVGLNQEAKDISENLNAAINDFVDSAYPKLSTYAHGDLARYIMLRINVDFMQTKSAAMSKSIGKIKSRLTKDPDIEVTLDRLQSEVDRYRELYNLFVQHSQYAAIDQSAKKIEAESKYMIVQPAEMPLAPISPNRIKMLVMGVILGLMLGVGIILILVLMDDSFKKVEEVESDLKLPVLATIPRLPTPYGLKRKERGLIYAGTVISLLLIAAIIFMKFKNG